MMRSILVLVLAFLPALCQADEFEFDLKSQSKTTYLDRWMYPFNVTPGSRIQAPTFGALGSEGFDERDGQFLIALNTAELGITPYLASQQYRINSATLTLTETFGGYKYDPSYDGFGTYLAPESGNYQEDEDVGRPIELYGVGFRGDFTEFAWPDGVVAEAPSFGSANPMGGEGGRGKRVRAVFAADADGVDVSNNVDSLAGGAAGFDPKPFAVAHLVKDETALEPGETVTARTQWVFDINVEDHAIHSYFANALSVGQLGLSVTSMHSTGVQGTGDPFPNPATANHFAFNGPVLSIDVDVLEGVLGDFNGDHALTATDIDLLSVAVRDASTDTLFDLTDDGLVTLDDRQAWSHLAGTIFGDANLDGIVTFPDFSQLAQGFGNLGGWADGDFDGSGDVAFPDFQVLAQNFGQSANAIVAVPEPGGIWSILVAGLATLFRIRRLQRHDRLPPGRPATPE